MLPPFLYPSFPPPTPLSFSLAVRPLSRKMGLHFHRETTFAHYEVLRAKPRRPAEWRSRELTLNITRTSREPSVRTIFILSVFLFLLSPSLFLFVVRANERSFGRKNIRYPPDFRRDDDDEIISRHGERRAPVALAPVAFEYKTSSLNLRQVFYRLLDHFPIRSRSC